MPSETVQASSNTRQDSSLSSASPATALYQGSTSTIKIPSPFDTTPPEILAQIIRSTLPDQLDEDEYATRRSRLANLCLVSRSFHRVARPYLFDTVFAINHIADLWEAQMLSCEQGWSGLVQRVLLGDDLDIGSQRVDILRQLCAIWPNLRNVALCDAGDRCNYLDLLGSLTQLEHLCLFGASFDFRPSVSFPALRSLTLNAVSLKRPGLARLLDPTVLPSLRYFTLDSDGTYDCGSDLRRSKFRYIVPHLDLATIDLFVWKALNEDCLASRTSSILIDWHVNSVLEHRSPLGGIRHLRLKKIDSYKSDAYPYRNIELLENDIRSSKQLHLRTLYLEEPLTSEGYENYGLPLGKLMYALVRSCRAQGVRVVYEKDVADCEHLGPIVSPDFWTMQRAIKAGRVIEIGEDR